MLMLIFGAVFVGVLGLVVLLYWLGARGQFLFLDNIVRNRGAIVAPWKFYARPANGGLRLPDAPVRPGSRRRDRVRRARRTSSRPGSSLASRASRRGPGGLVFLVIAYIAFLVVFVIALFLFREWGIALMFRNGLTVREALVETWRLVMAKPGSTALFILLRIALCVALIVLSLVACCFTCCVVLLPYLGTVVLLPALIYIRCFSLDCLAQFGPMYDVWTVDVASVGPVSPLPPPG